MQYPWPYPYWPQQPPTPTAHTIPIHPTHAATPHLQPHMMPTIPHMPQPTWQPTPLPQFQPPLQLTIPVPHPQAYPVPFPISQQELLPSQPDLGPSAPATTSTPCYSSSAPFITNWPNSPTSVGLQPRRLATILHLSTGCSPHHRGAKSSTG